MKVSQRECLICGEKYFGEVQLTHHVKLYHIKTILITGTKLCPLCGKYFVDLYEHITNKHPGMDIDSFCLAMLMGIQP